MTTSSLDAEEKADIEASIRILVAAMRKDLTGPMTLHVTTKMFRAIKRLRIVVPDTIIIKEIKRR